MSRAELHPPGLPPSAVLVVREMAAVVPARAVGPGGSVAAAGAWEREVREHLATCHRTAARPERGRVPADAEAVVFSDVSEWLACVLVDAGGGGAPRWWWPPRLRAHGAAPALPGRLAALLIDEARAAPPMFDRLVRWGEATAAFCVLPAAAAEQVLQAVLAAYEIGGRAERAGVVERRGRTADRGGEAGAPDDATPDAALRRRVRDFLPPGASSALAPAQARLLAVSLALVRAPDVLRPAPRREDPERPRPSPPLGGRDAPPSEPETAGSVADPASGTSPVREPRINSHPTPTAPTAASPDRGAPPEDGGGARSSRVPAPAKSAEAGARAESASSALIPETARRVRSRRVDAAGEGRWGVPVDPAGSPASERFRRVRGGSEAAVAQAAFDVGGAARVASANEGGADHEREGATASAGLPFEHGVETGLAGVLYLLNLFAHVDVAAAFEAWRRRGVMGPWALLELVARGLLYDDPAEEPDDPLWEALALLDRRRPGAPPGLGVSGRAAVSLPVSWLRDAEDGDRGRRWASRGGRLCVWSAAGYPVALVPRDRRAGAVQALAILGALGLSAADLRRRPFAAAPLAPLDDPASSPVPAPVRPWLAVVVPFLRYRLCRALGPGVRVADVLRRPGRLFVTSSHVDLVQPVEAITLPVRRAGLDRDPGWLPAFGRVVYFHFDGPARLLR